MNLLNRILLLVFLLFWMLFVFIDYWQKHPIYYYAFQQFKYGGLAVFLLLLGAGVTWGVLKLRKPKKNIPFVNGLSVYALFLLVSVASVGFAYGKTVSGSSFDAGKAMNVLILLLGTSLATYFITLAGYVLGSLINWALRVRVREGDSVVAAIASGLMGLVLFLFLLGSVSMLHSFILFPVLAVLFFFGRKEALHFLKTTLWQPVALDKNLNAVGVGSFYLLLCLMGINFTSVNVPMPAGFDSLTLYANLPSLIGQHHALLEGFQPYNWSLLMSLGHVLFGSIEVSLALSWLGGTLALYAMYVLCRGWLKMNVNYSVLAALVFALTPAFTIQAAAELKVDLGLLFVYLAIVLLLFNYLKKTAEEKPEVAATISKQTFLTIQPELLLMALLTGFGLGIKLTTVFFAFAMVCALWYAKAGNRGFFAAFLGCLFLVFFLKIDDFGGLRKYHLGVGTLQWGVLLAAVLLLAGIFFENKKALQSSFRASVVYGLLLLLPFVPWLVKNYAESKSLSPQVLLNGIDASPAINLQLLEKNEGQ